MRIRIFHLVTAMSSAAVLFVSAPAWACRGAGGCDCPHRTAATNKVEAKSPATAEEGLAATCNCEGPSDCTCKKGQCKCKKCPKHHGATGGANPGVKKTQLLTPVHGGSDSAELPANAPLDASAGFFI
jgi:hypothetical protein